MGLKLRFCGAAGEVTGSRHLVEAGGASLLLDCGLFQGHRHEALAKNRELPFDPKALSAVLLSHAHIDHSGGLPILAKRGFPGPVYCTPATADLCGVMLPDSGRLQEEDAKFFNKIHARQGDPERIEPLYDEEDAKRALARLKPVAYGRDFEPAPGVAARFLNAGHVLGSAMIEVEARGARGPRRLLFTGDLGRRHSLLREPPRAPRGVDYLLIEATYGGRLHEALSSAEARLREILLRVGAEKGKLLIPAFALERTQELLFLLERIFRSGQAPRLPVYVDSPMAAQITEIFRKNLGAMSLSAELKAYAEKQEDPFGAAAMRCLRTKEESQALNERPGPLVILAGSGMCEGGRILHHLRNNIDSDKTTVLLVGFQAPGTLGRRLAEGAKKVKIFGLAHEAVARVEMLHSLSAHADREDLLRFIRSLEPRPRRIFLVHGDEEERTALRRTLSAEGIERVAAPNYRDAVELD